MPADARSGAIAPTSRKEVGFSSLKPLCLTLENSLMKKSLVALAALAVSGAAMAQVTIGGLVDQAYFSVDQKSRDGLKSTKQTGIGEGAWAGSRIRFSGTEDLGGGLKANFWLEQGIAPEQARLFLPAYGMYVTYRWSCSLQSVALFLNQRLGEESQVEIQEYAKAVFNLTKEKFPVSIDRLVSIHV